MNRKRWMPVLGIVLAATLAILPLSAQEEGGKKSVLSVQVGPSGYTGRFLGITRPTHAYRSDLRPGMAWNVFYGYRGLSTGKNGLHVGPGLLYQGSFYRASWTDGSDHIGMHYFAPQFAFFGQHGPWAWQAALGVGWLHYNDHSRVYGKPRQVTMNKLGGNLSVEGEYLLTPQWGISARLNWLLSTSDRYQLEYHGEHYSVKHPDTGEGYFGQLALLVGVNWHF